MLERKIVDVSIPDGTSCAPRADGVGNLKIAQAPCTMTIVDLATDADVVVTASPAVLLGVYVNVAMSAHAALLKDAATTKLTLPASTAAGTKIDCHSGLFSSNITVESNDSGTGTITVFWRAI